MALMMSAFTFLISACGVPAGATKACQPTDSKPGSVSATVGKFGADVILLAEATASGTRLPASIAPARPE